MKIDNRLKKVYKAKVLDKNGFNGENVEACKLRSWRPQHTGKCKSTGAGCNELVQSKLRTGVRLKWRKR